MNAVIYTQRFRLAIAARLAGGAVLCLVAWHEADAQQAPAAGQEGPGAAAINNDEDFTRPETLFQLRYLYQAAPGSGSVPGTARTVTTDQAVLRSDLKIDLAPQWTLALRGDLPFVAKNAITPDDPTGGYAYGLGDAFAQAALIDTLSARWAAGVGLRVLAPAGTDNPAARGRRCQSSARVTCYPKSATVASLPDWCVMT